VIELKSDSDRLKPIQKKMHEYLEQGAHWGWLIDSGTRTVEIYRPDREVEKRSDIDRIKGEGPVAGFVLDLSAIWNPLAD
jgi:Uma2 family endonuclease